MQEGRSNMFRKLSSSSSSSLSSVSSVSSVDSSASFCSARNLRQTSRWCAKNCQHCNMIFCGDGEFCTQECRLSFCVRDYPAEAIDELLQDIGGLACRFDDSK